MSIPLLSMLTNRVVSEHSWQHNNTHNSKKLETTHTSTEESIDKCHILIN